MILHWNKRLANTDNKSYYFLFINLKECDDFLYCLFENAGEFPSRIVCGKIAREKRIKLLVFIALICSIYFFTNFVIILILTSFLFCFYFKHMNSLDNCRNKIRKNIYMCEGSYFYLSHLTNRYGTQKWALFIYWGHEESRLHWY